MCAPGSIWEMAHVTAQHRVPCTALASCVQLHFEASWSQCSQRDYTWSQRVGSGSSVSDQTSLSIDALRSIKTTQWRSWRPPLTCLRNSRVTSSPETGQWVWSPLGQGGKGAEDAFLGKFGVDRPPLAKLQELYVMAPRRRQRRLLRAEQPDGSTLLKTPGAKADKSLHNGIPSYVNQWVAARELKEAYHQCRTMCDMRHLASALFESLAVSTHPKTCM